MSVEFKFDRDAFERLMREQIEAVAARTSEALQTAFDQVHAEYPGPDAPVASVRSALHSALAGSGIELTDPELGMYSEKLAAGHAINVRTEIVD